MLDQEESLLCGEEIARSFPDFIKKCATEKNCNKTA